MLDQWKIDLIVDLLACAQNFMRHQNGECSFVSLRDVQRVLTVIQWFLKNGDRSALQMKSNTQAEFEIEQLKMRRRWENDPHPSLFFNPDGQTFTFFGFNVDRNTGYLLDPNTNNQLFQNLQISKQFMAGKKFKKFISLKLRLYIKRSLTFKGIELQDRNLLRENIS